VNYEASAPGNENTYFDKKNNIANLLVNIILLCIIVGAISLAAGLAFVVLACFCGAISPVRFSVAPTRMNSFRLTFERQRRKAPQPGLRLRRRLSNRS